MQLERVKVGHPLYFEVMGLLTEEASLLDNGQLAEWLELIAEDISYSAPVRVTVSRSDGQGFVGQSAHLDEDYASLRLRVRRVLETKSAWAEDPPSRTRRFVTNITVDRATTDEVKVSSYLLLLRNRWDAPTFDVISAQRDDVWRRADSGWKLARRVILVDQASLGTSNMALLL